VEQPDTKPVLLYDERPLYMESLTDTLENLGALVQPAPGIEAFFAALETGTFSFALVSAGLIYRAADLIKQQKLGTTLVLLADLGETTSIQGIPVILMPAYTLPVANVLNRITESRENIKTEVPFIAPEARILIVDDIMTNLKVAQGLLLPYRIQIDICESGAQSISLVQTRRYDLVFMDHMMPGIDGIEAVARIRAWEEKDYATHIPIIALTANAVTGMRELFLSKGFNDYLAKPIDISKLNEIMEKWIPREKHQKSTEPAPGRISSEAFNLRIEGLDTRRGLLMTGGSESAYREVLSLFCRDAEERLSILPEIPDEEHRSLFIIQIHALKGASATIGAGSIAAEALSLEEAGTRGDMKVIKEQLGKFREKLIILIEHIRSALLTAPQKYALQAQVVLDREQLLRLKKAIEETNIELIDQLLEEFLNMPLRDDQKQNISAISNEVLMAEFKKAIELVEQFLVTIQPS
jgi:CheY-like chemotaxis protein/HPt (histidine-containing phosphotransfer) domain-containing protein